MIINSNDIFAQIGLAVGPQSRTSQLSKPKYVICLEIQLNEDEKHILQVKYISVNAAQGLRRPKSQHRLNKLAVQIVEDKIREAMQFEEHKLISHRSRSNHRSNTKVDSTHHNNRNDGNLARSPRKQSPSAKKGQIYNDGKSNQKSKGKSRMSKTASSDNIYLRGLVKSRLIEQQRSKMKVQMEKKEEEALTFKPKINNVSEKIVQFLRTNEVPKIKKPSPQKKMYDQMAQCTFKPRINKVSERIVSNKSILKEERQNHKRLYEQQQKNKSKPKKTAEKQQYSFQPKINPKSSQKVTIPFFKRLQILQQKRNKAMNERQTFYDQAQCSFQPKINRGPLRDREKDNKNIWEYLYSESKKQNQGINSVSNPKVTPKENAVSQQYYENLIQDRINSVFETLDSNNDGLVCPNDIAIQKLQPQCLQFLKPIFMEMDEINAVLNCYEFKRAVKALMADSDPGVRGAFLAAKWKKEASQQHQFRPIINKKSKQLTCNRSIQNLYREGVKQKQNREYRLEKQRAIKEQKELIQCSFKPVLNKSSQVYIERVTRKKQQHKNGSVSEIGPSFMADSDNPL